MTRAINLESFNTEILWSRLAAATDEAAFALMRTAFSGVVRENLDFACGLFDADARLLVQDRIGTPGLAGPMPRAILHFLDAFPPAALKPRDVLITNDPWMTSGHLHDFTLLSPIFFEGRICGYAMCIAHHIDVGGRGAMSMESRDVFEEGIHVRPSYLLKQGEPYETIWNVIADNVRYPEMVLGDIRAQLASNAICSSHLLQMVQSIGPAGFQNLADSIINRTEATTRTAIKRVPDGTYDATMIVDRPPDRNGNIGEPVQLCVSIKVVNDTIDVDFTGTSPQVEMAFNSPLNGLTTAYVLMALKCVLDPEMPVNHGFIQPIRISAPEGTLLNPKRPAPVVSRNYLAHVMPELLFTALAKVVPNQVIAASGTAPAWNQQIEGTAADGRRYAHFFPVRGGLGARPDRDGISCISFPTNITTLQVEVIEADSPIIVDEKEILCDSAGPGRFRGGCGQVVALRVLEGDLGPTETMFLTIQGGRFGRPVPGLGGGGDGAVGSIRMNDEGIRNGRMWRLAPGDRVEYRTPGGGGYHDPLTRDVAAVADDVRKGYVSVAQARSCYGVVSDGQGNVDSAATAKLRS